MQHIPHNIKENNYRSENYINKFGYIKKTTKDMYIYQIFKIVGLNELDDHAFNVEKYFYFCVPIEKNIKCFCYTGSAVLKYNYKDELYILDDDEYLDTFREFIKNDGKLNTNLPSKLIQDKVY